MSQAEKPNTTSRLSRRAALAGLSIAAAAGVALPALAGTSIEPDPIYASIERHRLALNALDSRCSALDEAETPEAKEELDALYEALADAEFFTEPTTIAGAATLLRYVADLEEKGASLPGQLLDIDQLANALARMAGKPGLSVATWPIALPAGAAEVDPIFAAIERYKAAVRERAVVLAAEDACDAEWDDKDRDACDAEWEAFDGLFETPTTSIAGIAALLELLGTDPYSEAEFGPGESVLGWAYNNGPGSPLERAANRLMSTLAGALRTMAAQAIGGRS